MEGKNICPFDYDVYGKETECDCEQAEYQNCLEEI